MTNRDAEQHAHGAAQISAAVLTAVYIAPEITINAVKHRQSECLIRRVAISVNISPLRRLQKLSQMNIINNRKRTPLMHFLKNDPCMDLCARYPLHLCQPDASKSCGACCGLYNWPDHSRQTLTSLLKRNTDLFWSLGENFDIKKYQDLYSQFPLQQKLCETIYNCEFLGYLDSRQKKIGCLLHPALHNGDDLRDCSFYGVDLCDGHFCPSYSYLTVVEQVAAITALDDWYLYGLVITDIDFIKELVTIAQNRLGEGLHPEKLKAPRLQKALHHLLKLKECWKFASNNNRLGKYYFSRAEYHIARIEHEQNWNIRPSRFDKILISLSSEFKSAAEVAEAESLIEEKLEGFIKAYTGHNDE